MPITFTTPENSINEKLNKVFPIPNSFIKVSPGNVIVPKKYQDIAKDIRNLPIYPDDTWLVSYPRTGSTWAQEMIWLLANNLDFKGAKNVLQIRCPMVELSALFGEDHHEWVTASLGNTVDYVKNMPRPRLIRSHLPLQLLPREILTVKPKVIYTSRNPKDLCVSFYYYCKLLHGLKCSIKEFFDLFLSDSLPMGPYWSHVIPFWEKRNDPNILFLKYEDMNRNLPQVIKQCAMFLKLNYHLNEDNLKKLCDHLQFENMQSNSAVNLDPLINRLTQGSEEKANGDADSKFIRKGKIGDWKNVMSKEISLRFDDWIAEYLNTANLKFDYD